MDHRDSQDTADTPSARPSAIERQQAAVSGFGYGNQAHLEGADSAVNRRESYYYSRRRRPRRFSLMSFFVLFLVIVAGVALVFTEFDRPLQNTVGGAVQREQQTSAAQTPPASAPQTVAPKPAPEVATTAPEVTTTAALSVPIADISLRNRPELLEQLVQVYKSQLAANPNDAEALAALNQLQEKSLAELQTIVVAEDDQASARSLEVVSRLFPELKDNPRYKYLIARTDHNNREPKTEPPAEPQKSTPITPTVAASPAPPVKNVSPPSAAPAEIANKPAAKALSQKPQIRVVSVTPGTMIDQRFVPGDEGKAFLVEISYRNFKNSEDQSDVTLVAMLGTPGDPTVLAEAPVDILGDRGTKSFLMEALIPGNTGEKYRLNFMLNGEFLASSTVRLSVPRQYQ